MFVIREKSHVGSSHIEEASSPLLYWTLEYYEPDFVLLLLQLANHIVPLVWSDNTARTIELCETV